MVKKHECVVVAESREAALELTALAAELCDKVAVIAVGDRSAAVNADSAYYIDTKGGSFISAVGSILKAVGEIAPDAALLECTKNGRYAAACLAAAHGTSAAVDASEVWLEGDRLYAKRMVYGGEAYKTVALSGFAVVCPVPGLGRAGEEKPCENVVDLPAAMPEGMEFVSSEAKKVQKVGLTSAKRVVGVGRGVKGAAGLSAVEAFAEKIGAEIGCTRPVAEEEKLLPRERYIGVSGVSVRPRLYIAAGISGQIQHMVGVSDSETIIAINKDKQAPIFKNCDFGVVGDAVEVIAALTARL